MRSYAILTPAVLVSVALSWLGLAQECGGRLARAAGGKTAQLPRQGPPGRGVHADVADGRGGSLHHLPRVHGPEVGRAFGEGWEGCDGDDDYVVCAT